MPGQIIHFLSNDGIEISAFAAFAATRVKTFREHLRRPMMVEKGIADRMHVHHVHDGCGEQAKRYHIERPPFGDGYTEALVARVIQGVDKERIPKGQYGALMIDEDHDFAAEWL